MKDQIPLSFLEMLLSFAGLAMSPTPHSRSPTLGALPFWVSGKSNWMEAENADRQTFLELWAKWNVEWNQLVMSLAWWSLYFDHWKADFFFLIH